MFYNERDIAHFEQVGFNFIETEQDRHLFWITLNRPEKRNAFTPTMVNELAFALAYANSKKDIWCVVIRANGPVFCAGMDMNVFQNPALDNVNASLPIPSETVSLGDVFRQMNKPTIAQVEGSVYAGGFLIVGGCTFVVAADTAEFSLPEVKRGLFPMQVLATLLEFMDPKQAMQLSILGDTLSAEAAQKIGFVTYVCAEGGVKNEVVKLADKILSNSPFAIGKGMEALRELPNVPAYDRFRFLAEQLDNIRTSDDAQEGIDAFRDKRKVVWRNG